MKYHSKKLLTFFLLFFSIFILSMNDNSAHIVSKKKLIELSRFKVPKSFPEVMYAPIQQACNAELDYWRSLFSKKDPNISIQDIFDLNPNIQCMGHLDENHDKYRCFEFAISMITGDCELSRQVDYPGKYQPNILLKNFFHQVPYAQNSDLIVFIENHEYTHFAFALNRFWFLSKIGSNSHIVKHLPYCIPMEYGELFFVLRLLPKYYNNKKLLVKDMYAAIEKNKEDQRIRREKVFAEITKDPNQ